MKRISIIIFCLLAYWGIGAHAQVYNNEWIDYNKTYYKFKVGKTGLHRIPQAVLQSAGLANTPVEQFQLFRNGVEVPIYTSVATGQLPPGAAIEFWGEQADGKGDKALYRKPEYQLSDKYSLLTDTAVYFLTVNASSNNKRLVDLPNNTAGNTLTPEPYFLHTVLQAFKDQISGGYAVNLGQYLYSSAYDLGEGYASAYIGAGQNISRNLGNLQVATSGPAAQFSITVAGNRILLRRYLVKVNNDSIGGGAADFLEGIKDTFAVPLNIISGATNSLQVVNTGTTPDDRMAVYQYQLTYPRLFHFDNTSNFAFNLPASASARYLQITAFANGGARPVLLDIKNGERYVGDISVAGQVRFVLPPSGDRNLILYSTATANITNINTLPQQRFTNYSDAVNQADYIIISNPLLYGGNTGVNPVAEYAQYRSSVAGGSYNAKVFDVDQITDQFGFGIKKTPLALRNFILYALSQFNPKPKHVFLVGKGTVYTEQRSREADPLINLQNLVPTWGEPASDVLLAAAPGTALPLISIGRLSAIAAAEVSDYLAKVKQYEAAQQQSSPDAADKLWMKNVAHIIGSGDPNLQASLQSFMDGCADVIADTSWGAKVHTFAKKTGDNVEQISDRALEQLFIDGLSLITYFGHSSSTGLDYNLDNPAAYNNPGKYPVFIALGCSAGDFYRFNAARFNNKEAVSEKYVLAPQRGTIGFVASTHFGVVSVLRTWNRQFYDNASGPDYGKSIGDILRNTAANVLAKTLGGEENFNTRSNIEETALHGDPAIKLNVQPKPDYIINDAGISVDPAFVSVAETSFKLGVQVQNTGKAVAEKLVLSVQRQYPDASVRTIIRDTVQAPAHTGIFGYTIPVNALGDKGQNKFTVAIDADGSSDELFETNNAAQKDVFVYEDEARPVYPYNFGIVTNAGLKLAFSTANPLMSSHSYQVEMDTTELFDSPLKWSQSITSTGGLIEITPGINYQHNTVYYWRVASVPDTGAYRWNKSSFLYLPNGGEGFNQSHKYQYLKSSTKDIVLDSVSNAWRYNDITNELFIRNAVWGTATGQEGDVVVNVNGSSYIRNTCSYGIIINVFDGNSFAPWVNAVVGNQGLYGSLPPNCGATRINNFEYDNNLAGRTKALAFLRTIPNGNYVVVRNQPRHDSTQNEYSDTWKLDEKTLGASNSMYTELLNQGFTEIDSINKPRAFALVYRKNDRSYATKQAVSVGKYDKITLKAYCITFADMGIIASPKLGPAKAWKTFEWNGTAPDTSDKASVDLIGHRRDGAIDTLIHNIASTQNNIDISSISAAQYPYLQAVATLTDTSKRTPYQLKHWRFLYDPVPEGAVAPNLMFEVKDSIESGEDLLLRMAFKNLSTAPFDSLKLKVVVTDAANVPHVINLPKQKPLTAGDTLQLRLPVDTKLFAGKVNLYLEVNPEGDQPEQFQFNNFIYRDFYVRGDSIKPLVDVTFDNVHILNRDIVSAKPNILIKLTDESKKLLLDDTTLLSIKVRNLLTNEVRAYRFDGDTLRFSGATGGKENAATVAFKPYFPEDGEYELMVEGKDKSGNELGGAGYRVAFQIINKPMISNMLNYPNPFTTSTAFVFTLTGSEVPQNMKIQILTITGKVVREITRQELGPLRIGTNITEFKWDGTDQFGQKLANGVYIYRVVAQVGGKALDKYRAEGDETDRYFNKGYGKMYLMR